VSCIATFDLQAVFFLFLWKPAINLFSEGESLVLVQLTIAEPREVQDTVIFDISTANDICLTLVKRFIS
jgi:hypothetical protein